MLLINRTHVLDESSGFIQSLESQVRHPIGINEISLLNYMFSNKGKVLSKQELMNEVWHKRGIVVESSSLLHSISSCRRGLEDRTGTVIRTERGIGYEFTGSVKAIDSLSEVLREAAPAQPIESPKLASVESQVKASSISRLQMLKLGAVFITALAGSYLFVKQSHGHIGVSGAKTAEYQKCAYQPTTQGEKLYFNNARIYQFEELSLMVDEQGRSISFSNNSGVLTCE